jgi:aminoglycoside 3-N-acetyltransferase
MKVIQKAVNKTELIKYFYQVGIERGDVVEVHSSLKSLGFVVGGARTVIDALMAVVGDVGTIVMPLQSKDNSEPSSWRYPPIAVELYDQVREDTPPFHPLLSAIDHMGVVVATFRNYSQVVCSRHPSQAFIAWGANAKFITANQSLNFGLGINSPTKKLYSLNAKVLLIGVDYNRATGLHLGEYLSHQRSIKIDGAAVMINNQRQWLKYLELDLNSEDFIPVGHIMENNNLVKQVDIANGKIKCFALQIGVKLVIDYLVNR